MHAFCSLQLQTNILMKASVGHMQVICFNKRWVYLQMQVPCYLLPEFHDYHALFLHKKGMFVSFFVFYKVKYLNKNPVFSSCLSNLVKTVL